MIIMYIFSYGVVINSFQYIFHITCDIYKSFQVVYIFFIYQFVFGKI